MSGQFVALDCPETGSTICAGCGAVDGISCTTAGTMFVQAGVEVILEATADMRAVTAAGLGMASASGVLLGTPATIQHSAGGAVQIYAGAGVNAAPGARGSRVSRSKLRRHRRSTQEMRRS